MKKLLSLKSLSHIYDKRNTGGINNLSFDIYEGEVLSVLGPSGSGKSTLLYCLNGKISNKEDSIEKHQELIISTVSQENKLNEKLNVFDNIAQNLRSLSVDEDKVENQVRTTLSYLELTNEIEKMPFELSSGQRQRVIIAQALSTNPNLLLFDEALGHLDATLRRELLNELLPLFKDKNITLINVTHNNDEALSISDRIMLLNYGSLQQLDLTQIIYEYPKNLFSAQFFSNSNAFITPMRIEGDQLHFKIFEADFSSTVPKDFTLSAHNEGLVVASQTCFYFHEKAQFKGKIIEKYFKGDHSLYLIQVNEQLAYAQALTSLGKVDQQVRFDIVLERLRFIGEV